jgi:hypothetical protein
VDRALWLLLGLRLRGWLRRLRRGLGSVRGILLCLFGLLVVVGWLLPTVLAGPKEPPHLEETRRLGPLVLIAFCVLNVLFSPGERSITFTPAEVNLLFPAPFGRRQLLLYKIVGTFGSALVSALFLAVLMRRQTASYLAAFVGLSLTLLFWQLFSMALALLASVVGARAFDRRRKLVLIGLTALAAVAALQAGAQAREQGWLQFLLELAETPVVQVVLAPVGWLIQASTAERVWPDLVQWAGLSLALDLGLLVLVLALDAHYLEASAAASEKLYARIQRMRRGGTGLSAPSLGKPRLGLPSLPYWGGVGPILWRQLTTALRSVWSLVMVLVFFGMVTVPMLLEMGMGAPAGAPVWVAVAAMLGMSLFVPPLLPFDFRGDVDRMDVLKTLPVPGWRLALGQLLTPMLVVTLVQIVVLAVVLALTRQFEPAVVGIAALLLPINLVVFGIENLFFLWFPVRLAAAMAPGDFQMLGRLMLLWMAKLFVLLLLLLVAGLPGALVYLATGGSWVAATFVGAVVVLAGGISFLPLLVLAFNQFDVARDVPA